MSYQAYYFVYKSKIGKSSVCKILILYLSVINGLKILFFLIPSLLFSQFAEIDSATRICNNQSLSPEQKINLCKKFILKFASTDSYDSALTLNKAINLNLKKYNNNYVESYEQCLLAQVAMESSLYDSAKTHCKRAIYLFKAIRNDTMICLTKNILGFTYYTMGNYEFAIENFIEATELAEKAKNLRLMATSYSYTGLAFYEKPNPDYKKSLDYTLKAHEISLKNKKIWALLLKRIAACYLKLNQHVRAKETLERALVVADSLDDKIGKRWSLFGMGEYYFDTKDYKQAIFNYNKAKLLLKKDYDLPGLIKVNQNLASCYYQLNQPIVAINYIDSAINYSLKNNISQTLADIYLLKSNIYQSANKSTEALVFYKLHVQTKDSLFNIKNNNNINELEAKYDNNQKAKEILLLNSQREVDKKVNRVLLLVVFISLVLIIVGCYTIYKVVTSRKLLNQKNIEIEKQKSIVEKKSIELANRQKEIIDSIHYAKRIQQSLLPTEKFIDRVLKNKS